jgi:hypothetical protein
MTVNVQIPERAMIADGVLTTFTFDFGYIESLDVYVQVDGVTQTEYSDYTISSTDIYQGGEIEFTTAPAALAVVFVFRFTTRSQNVDYESFTSFPADTHEWNSDKDMYILQELIRGSYSGTDSSGNPILLTFDLDTFLSEFFTRVTNSGGTDADLPMWVTDATAGVYAATVDLEANIPADEAVSTKPDGYIYIGI